MLNMGYGLNEILAEATRSKATDIHLAVGAPPKMRVYGSLEVMRFKDDTGMVKPCPIITDRYAEEIMMPLMDAKARATFGSSGQYDLAMEIRDVARFRVNLFKQKGAMAGVFRVLPTEIIPAETLGLPNAFFELTKLKQGMVLVTGATGSGKSTTLAAFVDIINRNMPKHIVTLEDPIEYEHWHSKANICQREVGNDTNTFNDGLRAALREDPDVILVGEMRDSETIDIALKSAETGHLLLSTLHTTGAVETIDRIVNSFPESRYAQVRNQFASVMRAVISQQLLPKATEKGFVVAYEILYQTKEVQKMLRENRIDALEDYLRSDEAKSLGMTTMDDSIVKLYEECKISRDTALLYAIDKRIMEKRI